MECFDMLKRNKFWVVTFFAPRCDFYCCHLQINYFGSEIAKSSIAAAAAQHLDIFYSKRYEYTQGTVIAVMDT